jgi:hypothetical protein
MESFHLPEIASHSGRNISNVNHKFEYRKIMKSEYRKPGLKSYLGYINILTILYKYLNYIILIILARLCFNYFTGLY